MDTFSELIGDSPGMRALRRSLTRLVQGAAGARRPPPILIQGETGTGKGLVAKTLHKAGARALGPFVDINCAAIPDTLLEAELFGYERGAFTDARRAKPGLFLVADRGTVFLDEIALLPLDLQAKLLKVLEERAVRRLGATREEPIDVWILCATNDDLLTSVREHRFREDLYHRLGVVTFTVPPLRQRGQDIVHLAENFMARACADYGLAQRRLSVAARERLLAYAWPGNVRELSNVIERATVLSGSAEVTAEALGLPAGRSVASSARPSAPPVAEGGSLQTAVQDRVVEIYHQTGGNISRMAVMLGISRATARAHVRRLGLSSGGGVPSRRPPVEEPRPALSAPAATPSPDAGPAVEWSGPFRWERRFVASVRVSLAQEGVGAWSESARILELAIDKVRGFGGRLEDLSPNALGASFGVMPVEEATRLAGHAALAIQTGVERMRQLNDTWEAPGIVIHADHALVGRFGEAVCLDRDSKDRFAERTDPLVTLARAGEILVTAPAAPLMGRRFALEEARPDDVATPQCYRLLGRAPDGLGGWGRRTPFVGRVGEMDWLRSHAGAVLRGEGRVVGVVGEAGVGKSRLIREFVGLAESRTWRVLEGSCDGGGRALYHLAAGLLRSYFRLRSGAPVESVRAVIAEMLAARGGDLDAIRVPVETLLGVPSDDARWTDLDPDERRRRTYEAVARLVVQEAAGSPLLVIIEDAHWIDAESQALLGELVSTVTAHRVLAIVSYRPEYHPRWVEGSRNELRLEPLPDPMAAELLHELVGRDDSLSPLKRQLVDWTGGNPLFLEESVRSLVESGALTGVPGGYVLAREGARIDVPPTVEGLLAVRIDRLSPTDRHVVQTAAVIGSQIPSRLLAAVARVCHVSSSELTAALAHLREAELLYERSVGGEIEFVFKHALTHEMARLGMPPSARNQLHRAILEEVEKLYGDAADERLDLLAHHAVGGEVWAKAVGYLNRAGHRALASAATQKAAECFEGALAALDHLPETPSRWVDAIDVHLNLRDVLWPLARMPEVLTHLREAGTLAERIGDVRRQGWAACYLCQYFWAVGDHEQALQAGDQARAIARELADGALAAESVFYRGIALLALGRVAAAEGALSLGVEEVDAALAEGEHQFPSRRFGRNGPVIVRSFLTVALGELGRFADGRHHGEAAVRLGRATDSPFALVAAMTGLGSLYLRKLEPGNAIPLLERALAICRTHRLYNWFANASASLGRAYLDSGRVGEGVALLEESARLVERTGVVVNRSRWLTYLGDAYLAAGRMGEARDVAERALEMARSYKERGHQAWALLLLAEVLARAHTTANGEALPILRRALALAEELGLRPLEVRCRQALAVFLAPQDPTAAMGHEVRAMELAAEIGMALPAPPKVADAPPN